MTTVRLPREALTLVPREVQTIGASVLDAAGSPIAGRTITWSSANSAIATVSPTEGMITAVAPGQVAITATVEGKTGVAQVTVQPGGYVAQGGGTVQHGPVTLVVPTGAISAATAITITPLASPPPSAGLVPGSAVTLAPTGTTFTQPVTIRLQWSAEQETPGEVSRYAVHRWTGSAWQPLNDRVFDPVARTVQGATTTLGPFAILAPALPPEERLSDQTILFTSLSGTLYAQDLETGTRRTLVEAGAYTPGISLDRTRIVYSKDLGQGLSQLVLANARGETIRTLTTGEFHDATPTFDAQGGQIFFRREAPARSGNQKIWSVAIGGGAPVQITFPAEGQDRLPNDFEPVVNPARTELAVRRSPLGGAGYITLLSVQGAGGQSIAALGSEKPAWSPDGHHIAYLDLSNSTPQRIRIVDPESGAIQLVYAFPGSAAMVSWSPDGTQLIFSARGVSTSNVSRLFVVNRDGTGFRMIDTPESMFVRWSRN